MSDVANRLDRVAMLTMIVLCTLWGIQQVAIKWAIPGISPLFQAGLRSLGAWCLVWAWAAYRGVPLWKADGTLWAGLLAGFFFGAEFGLMYVALEYTTASRGVLLLYTAPFMVSLGAVLWLPSEPMGREQWAGLCLAFCGVLVLFGEGLWAPTQPQQWIGDGLMVLAAVLWAATTLTIKTTRLARTAPEKTLFYQLGVSALLLLPMSWLWGERGLFDPTPTVLASLAFQTIVIAFASYLGWFWLIRHYPATRLATFSFLAPVLGVFAAVVLLGDVFTLALFMALFLVGLGITLGNRKRANET